VAALVGEHDVVPADGRREQAEVGGVAGAEQERRLRAAERGQTLFELAERIAPSGEQAGAAGPDAEARDRFAGARDEVRVRGEAEVVVGGKVDQAAAGIPAPQEACALAGGQGLGESRLMLVEGVHGAL
jgi:hypothetical protein